MGTGVAEDLDNIHSEAGDDISVMAKGFRQGCLYVIAAGIVCATLNSVQADSITALPNPFALSRLNANPGSLSLADDKGAFEFKDGAPDTTIEDPGVMTRNFVYYSSLQVIDPSLLGGDGFGGGGFVGGGGGGFGVPIPFVDYFPGEEEVTGNNAPVPAPGAAVLGLIGLGMVRRFKRRFA